MHGLSQPYYRTFLPEIQEMDPGKVGALSEGPFGNGTARMVHHGLTVGRPAR
jgi:hypothetical protein